MITLQVPDDPQVQAAIGTIALRHGQLEHVLKMTVKSILKMEIRDALDATDHQGTAELRKRIRKLAKQKFGDGDVLVRLDALLYRSRLLTARRNTYIHSFWGYDDEGTPVISGDEHEMRPIPTVSQLEDLANELANITKELNYARLEGFLAEALKRC
jgi:hypothetical protein